PTNGALLAYAIRQRYPGFSLEDLGLYRLSAAVRLAENAGLVKRNWEVKHLEVFPSEAEPNTVSSLLPKLGKREFLRSDIWQSLLYFKQWEAHYFDRATNQVVPATGLENEKYDCDPKYVKIEPVSEEVQKGWMRQFLAIEGIPDAASAPVDADQ